MAGEPVLAIDFGTSCTSVGLLVGDRVELVPDCGEDAIPSVVYAPARGSYEVGRRALMRVLSDPPSVVRSVKRIVGVAAGSTAARNYAAWAPFGVETVGPRLALKLRAGDHAPEQIVGMMLDYVRRLAEQRFGGLIGKALITTSAVPPAGYTDAIRRAARIAHLDVVATAPEPIAAALGVGLHAEAGDRRLVICDLGGGTFDVSALVQRGLRFSAIATHGDAALGGDDFDTALAEALAAVVLRSSGYDMHKDAVRWTELQLRCELAKRQLTAGKDTVVAMRDAYLAGGVRRDLSVVVDRPWAELCWRELLERAQSVVAALVARAGWRVEDVDRVALVGGSAQIPAFGRAIEAMFPGTGKVAVAPRADVAVAIGAALLTARFGSVARPVPVLEAAS
jgi:molecular chaperone DnaK (HSP70)